MRAVTTRISIVEAMRGAASISVAVFHLSGQFVSDIPSFLASFGWLGVDVFFVISGFVIPLSLYGRDYKIRDFPNFLLRRLVRLEPPYLVSIGLIILMWHVSASFPDFRGSAPSYSLAQIAAHLFYAIPLTSYSWLSPVYWSLAYEFVFYLIIGISFSFLINRDIELTILAIVLIAAVSFWSSSHFDVRIPEFAVGVLLMRLAVNKTQYLRIGVWIAACVAALFSVGEFKIGGAVLIATCAILFLRDVQCGRWAYFLGSISYSLYLTHTIIGGRVINLGKRFDGGDLYELLLIAVALGVSILFAVLFARWIEAPATRASRRIGALPMKQAAA